MRRTVVLGTVLSFIAMQAGCCGPCACCLCHDNPNNQVEKRTSQAAKSETPQAEWGRDRVVGQPTLLTPDRVNAGIGPGH